MGVLRMETVTITPKEPLSSSAGGSARYKEQSIRFGARMQNVWRFLVQHPGAGWRICPEISGVVPDDVTVDK